MTGGASSFCVVLHVPLYIPASFELVYPTGGVELNVFVL